jgi:hypothetical protein
MLLNLKLINPELLSLKLPYLQILRRTNGTAYLASGLAVIVSFILSSQATAQLSNALGKTVIIPAGTSFEGRMDTTLSSNHSHAGERFNVIMSSPVLANGSEVLIPAGSQIMGEVVEAISSSHQPHEKHQKLNGKLRVQLTGLKTPDGSTYPFIGSFIGETTGRGQSRHSNPNLGSGVAYIGSQANFNAVYPVNRTNHGNNRGPQLVTRNQMMTDPLYGDSEKRDSQYGQANGFRSIVKNHREMFIREGSPMNVRLDAPLKMSIVPLNGQMNGQMNGQTDGLPNPQFRENAASAFPAKQIFTAAPRALAAPPSANPHVQSEASPQSTAPAAAASNLAPSEFATTGSSLPAFLEPVPGSQPPPPSTASSGSNNGSAISMPATPSEQAARAATQSFGTTNTLPAANPINPMVAPEPAKIVPGDNF